MKQLSDAKRDDLKRELTKYQAERKYHANASLADELASSALLYSIIGLFFLGVVLGPMAISKGLKALDKMDSQRIGHGRAVMAILIGGVATLINAIALLLFLSLH